MMSMKQAMANLTISCVKITELLFTVGGVNFLVKTGCKPNCSANSTMYSIACLSSGFGFSYAMVMEKGMDTVYCMEWTDGRQDTVYLQLQYV
jgi:hypothetical protein